MDKTIFHKLSYGLYVIGSRHDEKINGQIANTVFQISADPPTVAISLNKNNLTNEFVKASKVFTVSILPQDTPLAFIGLFGFKSGRETDKYQGLNLKIGKTGAPIVLENTLGYIEAQVIDSIEVETHTLFIGQVIDAEVFSKEAPMTYAYYHQLKSGQISHKADNFINPEKKEDNKLKKYQCTVCGYIYDPAHGDPDSGIAPGTSFEDIPDDWVCPICGVAKDQFEEID